MTLADLRAELQRRLEATTSLFFTVADQNAALNEGYMEISDETEWFETWQTVDVLSARPYYDLRTVFDREVLTPGRAFNDQTNRWLIPASAGDLDRRYRRWEQIRSDPEKVIVRGLFWIGYWPWTAGDGTTTIKQYATVLPDPLVDDTDEPGFLEVFHLALVEYAVATLLPQQGDVTRALEAWDRYLEYEAALSGFLEGRGLSPQVQGSVASISYPPR